MAEVWESNETKKKETYSKVNCVISTAAYVGVKLVLLTLFWWISEEKKKRNGEQREIIFEIKKRRKLGKFGIRSGRESFQTKSVRFFLRKTRQK